NLAQIQPLSEPTSLITVTSGLGCSPADNASDVQDETSTWTISYLWHAPICTNCTRVHDAFVIGSRRRSTARPEEGADARGCAEDGRGGAGGSRAQTPRRRHRRC